MFFYGYYTSRFKKVPMSKVSCPSCGADDKMHMIASCRTYHFMFIPVFAGGKQVSQLCRNCKQEYYPFPEHANVAERMQKEVRRPWYLYFWLWLFLLFAIFLGVTLLITKLRG